MFGMSHVTPFLHRVIMSKSFYSFSAGSNSTFYGTSKFLILYFCELLLMIVQVNIFSQIVNFNFKRERY